MRMTAGHAPSNVASTVGGGHNSSSSQSHASVMLTREENHMVFAALGHRCQSLATAGENLRSLAPLCTHSLFYNRRLSLGRQVVKKFLYNVPLACFGGTALAVQPNGLRNSQKTLYKTFFTADAPD